MNDTIYYRSDHANALAYQCDLQVKYAEWRERLRVFLAQYPEHEPVMWTGHGGEVLMALKGSSSPGVGWLQRSGESCWRPDRRYVVGRKLFAEVNAMRFIEPPIPGMPARVYGPSRVYFCGMERHGGAVWAMWSAPPELVEADARFDVAIWQRAKASAFFLAREAEEGQP